MATITAQPESESASEFLARFITRRELKARWGCGGLTIRRIEKSEGLHGRMLFGQVRYLRSHVEALEQRFANRVAGVAEGSAE